MTMLVKKCSWMLQDGKFTNKPLVINFEDTGVTIKPAGSIENQNDKIHVYKRVLIYLAKRIFFKTSSDFLSNDKNSRVPKADVNVPYWIRWNLMKAFISCPLAFLDLSHIFVQNIAWLPLLPAQQNGIPVKWLKKRLKKRKERVKGMNNPCEKDQYFIHVFAKVTESGNVKLRRLCSLSNPVR